MPGHSGWVRLVPGHSGWVYTIPESAQLHTEFPIGCPNGPVTPSVLGMPMWGDVWTDADVHHTPVGPK